MQKNIIKKFCVTASVIALSACSAATYKEAELVCPNILIAKDTAEITNIVENQKLWKANITNYKGFCSYNKDKTELELDLKVDFTAELLKENYERAITFRYYVAAPALYPDPVGKQTFYLDVVFPEGKNKTDIIRKKIDLSFPLVNENGERVAIKDVYLGIQLDRRQLDFNRKMQKTETEKQN